MQKVLLEFIRSHHDGKSPLLLGLSGGPDSLSLFYLLMEVKNSYPFSLHLVHVDHGWREESREEAAFLQQLAKEHGLPFHLRTLLPSKEKGNLEEKGRFARLAFFKEVMQKTGAQAIFLAHQKEDQAETVLKRLFEGSHFLHLRGMEPKNVVEGVEIWRPLLQFSKNMLLDTLKTSYFQDPTNVDDRFLRGRMRTELMPLLSSSFGKEVTSSLYQFGEMMEELHQFFKEKLAVHEESGPWGVKGDFPCCSLFEMKLLFRFFCAKHHLSPPRQVVEIAAKLLLEGAANRGVEWGERKMKIDRKRVFLLNGEEVVFSLVPRDEGGEGACSWHTIWRGKGEVSLPPGELQKVPMHTPYTEHITLGEWYHKHQVPAFFRSQVPVWVHEGKIVGEFLTGRLFHELNRKQLFGTMKFYIDIRKVDNGRPK